MKILNTLVFIALIASTLAFTSRNKIHTSKKQIPKLKASIAEEVEKKETCLEPSFVDENIFEYELSNLKKMKPDRIIRYLPYQIKKSGKEMMSPKQTIRLFTEVYFGNRISDALKILRPFIWIHVIDLVHIMEKVKNLNERVIYLNQLFPVLLDHDEHDLEDLRDRLDCNTKELIEALKLKFKPKDCFFGDLSGNNVFIIDLSGSMMFSFKYKNKYITRLAFLKRLFERAITSLLPEQKFQIVTFSTNAKYIEGDVNSMFMATADQKKKAINLVNAMKVGYGAERYTNISEALEYGLKINSDFERVIFFSDGGPTRGIRGTEELTNLINGLQKDRKDKLGFKEVPVNMNLMMFGGGESTQFRYVAKYYTKLIAKITNGIVKNYDSKAKKNE